MSLQPLALGLTLVNLLLLAVTATGNASFARQEAPVLRGRALEIVDDQGRVRASIVVHAASTGRDGKASAESTVLRLITPDGKPGVKIAASEDTAGLAFVAEQGTYAQLIAASGGGSFLKFTEKNGRDRQLYP